MYFDLGEQEEKCIIEEIPDDTLVTGLLYYSLALTKAINVIQYTACFIHYKNELFDSGPQLSVYSIKPRKYSSVNMELRFKLFQCYELKYNDLAFLYSTLLFHNCLVLQEC